MRDRLQIDKGKLPYRVTVPVGQKVFAFEFHHNSGEDCFVCHFYGGDALVCGGEKLVYGRALFTDCYEVERYPVLRLVPWDESGAADVVSWETLGATVFLTVEDQGRY